MSIRRLIDHFESRLFELGTATMMLGLSIHVTLWPGAIAASAFRFMLEFLPNGMLAVFFAVAGLLRLAALVANGGWPYGAGATDPERWKSAIAWNPCLRDADTFRDRLGLSRDGAGGQWTANFSKRRLSLWIAGRSCSSPSPHSF
jgi:hypothetical protein